MANPVWQVANNSINAAGTSYIGTCPTGTTTNDLMVAFIWCRSSTAQTLTGPSPLTWTLFAGQLTASTSSGWLYYRVATASDVAGTTTYTWGATSSVVSNVVINRITGADTTTPIDGTASTQGDASAGLTHTALAVSPTSASALLLYCFGSSTAGSSGTVTAPLTEQLDVSGGTGTTTRWVYEATESLSASGSTGTRAMTSAGSTQGVNFMAAIAPTAAATPSLIIPTDSVYRILSRR